MREVRIVIVGPDRHKALSLQARQHVLAFPCFGKGQAHGQAPGTVPTGPTAWRSYLQISVPTSPSLVKAVSIYLT